MPLPFAEPEIWDENNKPVDGWVETGDSGRLDANGYLDLLHRADDMVISDGFNIYPAERENVIAAHPAIVEVVVLGIPIRNGARRRARWCA